MKKQKNRKNKARAARQALLPGIPAGIPQEIQESTMQVPFGEFSALSALEQGELNGFETMTLLTLGYFSNWHTGETWRVSQDKLSKALGVSIRHIRCTLSSLMDKGWLSVLKRWCSRDATRYTVKLHNAENAMVPTDKDGHPLTFAVPHKNGGIFERLFAGEITWRSALVWLRLKLKSDWATGITTPVSMGTLSRSVRMGTQTVVAIVRALADAGMLRKISKPYERSQFQLYPKPAEKRPAKRRKVPVAKQREMRREGEWVFSFNGCFKVSTKTGEIYQKASRWYGKWKKLREERYHEIPRPIKIAFDKAIEVAVALSGLRGRLGMASGF